MTKYNEQFKLSVVQQYLSGESGFRDLGHQGFHAKVPVIALSLVGDKSITGRETSINQSFLRGSTLEPDLLVPAKCSGRDAILTLIRLCQLLCVGISALGSDNLRR
jgi:hypothetical protein